MTRHKTLHVVCHPEGGGREGGLKDLKMRSALRGAELLFATMQTVDST